MLLGEVEWGRKQEARESTIEVALFTPSEQENTTYFSFTELHHWETVNIWLSCWGANFWFTLTTSHFLPALSSFLKRLSGIIPLFRSPPAIQQYFPQVSHRTCILDEVDRAAMKVTVTFGQTGVVVPCKEEWTVRDLIQQATQRYRKLLEQVSPVKMHLSSQLPWVIHRNDMSQTTRVIQCLNVGLTIKFWCIWSMFLRWLPMWRFRFMIFFHLKRYN